MIDPAHVVEILGDLGVNQFTGVPDSLLKSFCAHIDAALPRSQHVIAANEGAAVGIAMGHYLRTGDPALVYLQNSGFGNTVNPLLSLADPEVYGIPMVLLVGWRGQPGTEDEPQHRKQGRVMTDLLDALGLPWEVLPRDEAGADRTLRTAVETALEASRPSVVLVERGTFAETDADPRAPINDELPSREDALVAVVEAFEDEPVIVSTTGMLSRELFEYRQRSETSGERDFLTVGGMGHACSIALGVALCEPDRDVWCLDGDGAILMHLGSLAVIGDHGPENLFHVVFNNGVHDSVGGQPTSIDVVDTTGLAEALGYRSARSTSDLSQVERLVEGMVASRGPSLLELRVRPGNRPGIGRPTRTPAESKDGFMDALGAGEPSHGS